MRKALALLAFAFMATNLHAETAKPACGKPPKPVADYLAAHSDLKIIDIPDLHPDDQLIWVKDQSHQCPGLVAFDADGSKHASFGLGLMDPAGRSQVIVLHATADRYQVHSIFPPNKSVSSPVLFLAAPGDYRETEAGPNTRKRQIVNLKTEGVHVVFLEASSILIYLDNGEFKKLWTSD